MGDGEPSGVCPRCHSADQVRTVGELFDLLNAMQANASKEAVAPQPAPAPTEPTRLPGTRSPYNRVNPYDSQDQQLFNDLAGIAGSVVGRAIGKRFRRTYDERIAPALDSAADEQHQQAAQDQAAIIGRYPELRGCLHDSLLFLAGGTTVVPLGDVTMPITLAEADRVVARLRG